VLLGLETVPGPRWPDLAGAGGMPGEQILEALPRWGACAVLSADRWRPEPAPGAVVAEVLAALVTAAGALVLDLAHADVGAGRAPVAGCDLVVVVTGRDLGSVAGVLALRPGLASAPDRVGLAVRGPAPGGASVTEVAQAAGLPVLCRVPNERRLVAATERGALDLRGPAARAAATLARTALPGRVP
jgi:hypothetical protein